MSSGALAIDFVLENEGGLSINPHDKGGVTKYGISLKFLQYFSRDRLDVYKFEGDINAQSIIALTEKQARLIYRFEFWVKMPFFKIKDQRIANYVFDCCVHHGASTGIKILQRSLVLISFLEEEIKEDGILGEKTLKATNLFSELLLHFLPVVRAAHCCALARREPQYREFLHGWIKRCNRI